MEDNQLLATLLTVALHSSKPRETSKKTGPERWRNVWNDYNQFLKHWTGRVSRLTSAGSTQTNDV
jgi:hypothetical protein